ncbi:MAG: hypothetical protein IJL21_03700 [Alphaproteobacteria bacterium]|nr:hypothetical protein [Alphaproteobacteria bacterium]
MELGKAFLDLDEKRVQSLLAQGKDKNHTQRNEMLFSCIWGTVGSNDAQRDNCMKLLLKYDANPNWWEPDSTWYYYPPLLECLKVKKFEQAQWLVNSKANVNERVDNDEPLFVFFSQRIDKGHDFVGSDAMKFLHKNGADINATNDFHETALMEITGLHIYSLGYFSDTKWLIEPVEFLTSKGAKVNLQDKAGRVAMSRSLSQNWGAYYHPASDAEYLGFKNNFNMVFYYEIPKILFLHGARADIADEQGKTTMDIAKESEEKMDLFARAIDDSNKFLRRKIVVMSK